MRRSIRKKQRIVFDEVVSDSVSGETYMHKEQPIQERIFQGVFIFFIFFIAIIIGRTAFLSIVQYSYYRERAIVNSSKTMDVPAQRGIITDRFGTTLIENRPIFNVVLNVSEMIKNNETKEVLSTLQEIFNLDSQSIVLQIQKIDFESEQTLIVVRDITREQVLTLKNVPLTSLHIEGDYKRYLSYQSFSHVIGYVGQNSEDSRIHGLAGIEAMYNDLLRGVDGKKIVHRDAYGEEKGMTVIEKPVIGNELKTTLDVEFQEYFYERLKKGLTDLGRISGVGLAINPQTGEVLSMISLPDYDPNNISNYLLAPSQPLFNRVVSGAYNPASTIKLVHAAAALNEGVITSQKQIFSAGYIEIPNQYHPENPSRFVDWKPQGWVDVYSALARSSNVYFYEVIGGFQDQKGVGIERLRKYWEQFGFGKKTGIDIPGEAQGFLPNPEEKEARTGLPWRIGDTYNIAIGQGDFLVTPVQLVSAVSAIVNGGISYVPHVHFQEKSEILLDLSSFSSVFSDVRRGMRDVVEKPYGTAHALSTLPCSLLGKTGSAQVANNTKTNAIFIGAMPAEDPQIVILIIVEDAKEGSINTLPTAYDVLEWYCKNRIKGGVNDSAVD
ncbi:MAG: penicillin-binding transpeptidase domain-containing protein [bacterium]